MKTVKQRVLVTGASGFVGSALSDKLVDSGYPVRMALRCHHSHAVHPDLDYCFIRGVDSSTDWREHLRGMDTVIHTAARVHLMRDDASDPLAEYRRINVDGTLNLARAAAKRGVRRFIYISSIKVNGDATTPGIPFQSSDTPRPTGPYAISKYDAECELRRLSMESDLEVVIIRPPLVYGPGVRANFLALFRIVDKGIPLPFGAINNKRSLISLDNLIDLVANCIENKNAANQTFLASDGADLSTTELLKEIANSLDVKLRLIPVPKSILIAGGRLMGRQDLSKRLFGWLQVDISETKRLLDWTPPVPISASLEKTARHFRQTRLK